MNPYHDELGRFTSGPGVGQSRPAGSQARETKPGDTVKIAKPYGGGRGEIKDFSPSGEYALVKSSRGEEYHHMSQLTVIKRSDSGRVADIMMGLKPVGEPIKVSGRGVVVESQGSLSAVKQARLEEARSAPRYGTPEYAALVAKYRK